jgi:lipopolysaccharide export system ATP-binding protein
VSSVLTARGLTKSYGGRLVVNNVNLEIATGEVLGLLGPNGAGKTTTFKLILGLVPQELGTVQFDSPLDGLPLHKRARMGLGYLPQGASVFRGMTVRNNLLALGEALRKPNPAGRTDELLERFDLARLADAKADTLSGGERRRLEFARALISEPKILLCDEPFAGVDPLAAAEIARAIAELKSSGVGILLTDHSVRDALKVCDRICLIVEGQIIETGTPDEMLKSDVAKRLYLGDDFV